MPLPTSGPPSPQPGPSDGYDGGPGMPGSHRPGGGHKAERPRRLRPPVIGASCLALAVLVGVALIYAPRPSADAVRQAGDRQSGPEAKEKAGATPSTRAGLLGANGRLDGAKRLLDQQVKAVAKHDRKAYLATIDPSGASRPFADVAERTFENLTRMDVTGLEFHGLTEDQGSLTPDRQRALGKSAYVAETMMRFRLPAGDSDDESKAGGTWQTQLRLVFVERGGRTYLAGDREGLSSTSPLPLWLLDEVSVVEGERSLVIGSGSRERLERYARTADRAVPRVDSVWRGAWAHFVVIVVPRTQSQMERMINADPDSQRAVAAVTTSVGRTDPQTSSHIVVNPTTFSRVRQVGRLVVLSHETTHVATNATVSSIPIWLSEGFADYVGFHHSDLSTETVAKELFAQVRRDGPPDELPDGDSFEPTSESLDQAYESSWLACRYIAEHWGEQTLVRFYTQMNGVADEAAQKQVFLSVLDVTPQQFVRGWRDYVEDLAGS